MKKGNIVGLRHPTKQRLLKTGIIIEDDRDSITVKWISYDKVFFMEKEDDIFKDLNISMLLNTVIISRASSKGKLLLLNSI